MYNTAGELDAELLPPSFAADLLDLGATEFEDLDLGMFTRPYGALPASRFPLPASHCKQLCVMTIVKEPVRFYDFTALKVPFHCTMLSHCDYKRHHL